VTITLYNTLSKQKQVLEPLHTSSNDGKPVVGLYVCGPTVYDYAHIGNARPVIVFDVLNRLLRHVYGEDHVTYVRNITDVDDKINARAAEEGIDIRELTERTNKQFQADMTALNCHQPDVQPRATEHIAEMQALITVLIEKGFAYEASGHVLFHVPAMKGYGELSNRSVDEMQAGARVEVAPYKKDPMDFVLWKPSLDEEPGWDSPWQGEGASKNGRGRPGWHIECSAMAKAHLGEVFDIHGGGIDLVFPHHENEIAQSCCAHETDKMANIWMHNGYLQVEGEKMSKSLGNFITVNDVLEKWPGEVARLAMLMTHYRQPINWTEANLSAAQKTLDGWYGVLPEDEGSEEETSSDLLDEGLLSSLADDLNTPKAISILHQLKDNPAALKASANLMGLLSHSVEEWAELRAPKLEVDEKEIEALIAARLEARENKDWAEADRLRDELVSKNIVLMDGDGFTDWEVKS
jgi:cysteinyl-tRNA synthetase